MSDVWQFNETVSLLREARRIYVSDGSTLAAEIDEALPRIQAALEAAADSEPWMSIEGDGSGHRLPEFNAEIESIDDPCAAERALADDLAAALASIRLPNGYQYPAVQRVLDRYHQAREL